MKACFFLILFFAVPELLQAASSEPANFILPGLRLFSAMALVIGIMLLLHILNRKGYKFMEKRNTGRIKIVETRPVGGRKSLCLVEIRGEEILLGLGNDRIDFLYHLDASPGRSRFETELREKCGADK